ncbi:MAG: peptidoglycan D,D-transpeptidase FtsI family protein [Oscillospiraceae bacterium]
MKRTAVTVTNKKRIAIGFIIIAVLMVLLAFRVAWIQVVDADELTEKAIDQQTSDIPIAAKRGVIYDRNGKELATSVTCYSVWVRPAELAENKTDEEITAAASDLAAVLNMEAEEVKTKLTKKQALVKVAQYLEKDTADQVRDLEITGISLSEDTRRYYPLGNFASQLLGSVTVDNTGRTGIELEYDQYLSGVSGRWVKNTDVAGNELVDGSEKYYEAEDGLNVVLTIDEAIQYYVEKALEEGMEKTDAEKIMCLVMDPKTGEILASAVTPGFDPNNATEPDDEEEKEAYEALSDDEKIAYLNKMWRNPIVSDTYEPGSTFKLITASSALEEKVISTTDTFTCNTKITVAGVTLHCWSTRDHGTQTIKQALGNSCNPVLAAVAGKMGAETFYKYIDLFGITEKTGVDYPGETGSIMYNLDDVGPVELATIGYGQSISLTPIQLLTAVCAIGNDGILLQPRYVKSLTDSDGKVVKEFKKKEVRRVLSEETAAEMREAMEYVVSDGGAGAAKITGYRIGGKTGTANKVEDGKYGNYYYSSFLGMAPMDDPKIAILVVVDSPKGSYYGSLTAGPYSQEHTSGHFEIHEYRASVYRRRDGGNRRQLHHSSGCGRKRIQRGSRNHSGTESGIH